MLASVHTVMVMLVGEVQAPYHDVRGHCVVQIALCKSGTRMPLVAQYRKQGGSAAGLEDLVEHMCDLVGLGCNQDSD